MIPIKDDNPVSTKPVVTIALILLNVVMFYYELQLGFETVIKRYGAIPANIVQGQDLETLFTSMFLHGGLFHLLGNMLYLWIFGDNIEHYLGHFKFIAFYFLCGLAAVFAHIILGAVFGEAPNVPMVGASGAISGVLGAYFVKYPKARVLVIIPIIFIWTIRPIPALFVLGLWFIMQLFSGVSTIGMQGGGVAFWAHIGGFVAGVILIFLFPRQRRSASYF